MLICFEGHWNQWRRLFEMRKWTSHQSTTLSLSGDQLAFQKFRSCFKISSMAVSLTSPSIQMRLLHMELVSKMCYKRCWNVFDGFCCSISQILWSKNSSAHLDACIDLYHEFITVDMQFLIIWLLFLI